jgi:hypothetical protein
MNVVSHALAFSRPLGLAASRGGSEAIVQSHEWTANSPSSKGRYMTQSRLYRAVARATGESLDTIRSLGFSIVKPDAPEPDPTPASPQVVDWDDFDAQRIVLFPIRPSLAFAA